MRPGDPVAAPDAADAVSFGAYRVLSLVSLVRMKLTANRDKDKAHLRGMLENGLIDATWPARYPPGLADRLQLLIDTPEG